MAIARERWAHSLPLLAYDNSSSGADAYIEAAKKAFKRDYSLLTKLIAEALERSR